MYTNEKSIGCRIWYGALTLGIGLFFFVPAPAGAATLSLVPSNASVSIGSTVTVSVFVNSEGIAINNAEGNLFFSKSLFDVVSINKDASLFTLWIAAPIYDGNNTISWNGGLPSPGYQGSNGRLFSVTLRAKTVGATTLTLLNGAVRANDGLGTDVLNGVHNATVTIAPPVVFSDTPSSVANTLDSLSADLLAQITSSTHPDETKWYNRTHVVFDWTNAQDVTAVRLGYDQNADSIPQVLYTNPISHKEIDLKDGIWYFHMQGKRLDGWGPVSTFRIQIDTVPPLPMTIQFPNGATSSTPTIAAIFGTSDALSGINHYELSIDGGVPQFVSAEAESKPFVLPPEFPGSHTLLVTAVDNAGNVRNSSADFTIEAIDAPAITYYPETMGEGDILKIRGTTYPDSDVTVYIREGNTLVSEEYTRSNTSGDFAFVAKKWLDSGVYAITARVKDGRGAQSNETAPLTVSVRSEFVSGIVSFVLKYLSVAILALLALGGIAWVGLRLWFKIPRTVARMRREAREAERVSDRAFKVLREGVLRHIARLKKARRNLTSEEMEFLEEFSEKLEEAEEVVAKEIRDISGS
ncbi:MAG: hypothetical protein NUV49_02880 [Patescibacteria group bacterium]|nr:hypothetical protein [Patescibacteria group bacterium]